MDIFSTRNVSHCGLVSRYVCGETLSQGRFTLFFEEFTPLGLKSYRESLKPENCYSGIFICDKKK